MAALISSRIGTGLYTVAEAAIYAKASRRMISRWVFGTAKDKPLFHSQFERTDDKLVSFLDMLQSVAIREIRLEHPELSMNSVRQAIEFSKKTYGVDFPFVRKGFVAGRLGGTIVIHPSRDQFVEASGKSRGQTMFPFVQMYLDRVGFGDDGLANEYRIYEHGRVQVTMKPNIRFGEPLLPSGYSAWNIWESIKSEGGIDRTAKAFRIPRSEVRTAYSFVVDHLGKAA